MIGFFLNCYTELMLKAHELTKQWYAMLKFEKNFTKN